jgi:hypothetical protein
MATEAQVLACDLTALPAGGEKRLSELCEELFGQADEVRVRSDGFEFGFSDASPETIGKLAEFISLDRLCCAFLAHGLFHEPHERGVWLQLTGAPGVKELIAADRRFSRLGIP